MGYVVGVVLEEVMLEDAVELPDIVELLVEEPVGEAEFEEEGAFVAVEREGEGGRVSIWGS